MQYLTGQISFINLQAGVPFLSVRCIIHTGIVYVCIYFPFHQHPSDIIDYWDCHFLHVCIIGRCAQVLQADYDSQTMLTTVCTKYLCQ